MLHPHDVGADMQLSHRSRACLYRHYHAVGASALHAHEIVGTDTHPHKLCCISAPTIGCNMLNYARHFRNHFFANIFDSFDNTAFASLFTFAATNIFKDYKMKPNCMSFVSSYKTYAVSVPPCGALMRPQRSLAILRMC